MEFPELGKHCSLASCKQLDFLPFTCDACKKIFCKDHVAYETHSCQESYQKDRRALVCPLCNQPISSKPGDVPDARVNEHIENDCKSDLAKAKRKTYTNRCSAKGCKQRELVPVLCNSCKQNFCLRHRHENDHNCPAKASSSSPRQAAASRSTKSSSSSRLPQQTSMSNLGSDLNRARQERQQQRSQPQPSRPIQTSNQRPSNLQQPAMTEDEALAFAIQASLSDTLQSTNQPPKPTTTSQEDEDLALARAIAESEREERNRRSQQRQNRGSQKDSSCSLS